MSPTVQPPPLVTAGDAKSTKTISLDNAIQQLYNLVHKIVLPTTRTAKAVTITVEDLHLARKLVTSAHDSRQDRHEESHLKDINRQLEAITAHLATSSSAPTPQKCSYASALATGTCGPSSDITPPPTRPRPSFPLPFPHPAKRYDFTLSRKA